MLILCLAALFLFPKGAALHAAEAPADGESAQMVLTSVFCIANLYYLSGTGESGAVTLLADAAAPCLYQGKIVSVSQLKPGSKCLISYAEGRVSSILVLTMEDAATNLYGMYYQYLDGILYLTLPGGQMQGFPVSSSAHYFINDKPVSRDDFLRLSLPGDDIQIYLNSQKQITKAEGYVIKDNIIGKTNVELFH